MKPLSSYNYFTLSICLSVSYVFLFTHFSLTPAGLSDRCCCCCCCCALWFIASVTVNQQTCMCEWAFFFYVPRYHCREFARLQLGPDVSATFMKLLGPFGKTFSQMFPVYLCQLLAFWHLCCSSAALKVIYFLLMKCLLTISWPWVSIQVITA